MPRVSSGEVLKFDTFSLLKKKALLLIDEMCYIWHNRKVRKTVLIDKRADKEIKKFPRTVQLKFQALFEILEKEGKLEEPFAKKLSGSTHLFEIRVKYQGQWRALYVYLSDNLIVILSAFSKKTQKTPLTELEKAKERRKNYDQI